MTPLEPIPSAGCTNLLSGAYSFRGTIASTPTHPPLLSGSKPLLGARAPLASWEAAELHLVTGMKVDKNTPQTDLAQRPGSRCNWRWPFTKQYMHGRENPQAGLLNVGRRQESRLGVSFCVPDSAGTQFARSAT